MPNWKTHLEVAKRINEKIKFTGEKYNQFLLGNVLPDVNNGYAFSDLKIKLTHSYTHYKYGSKAIYENFYDIYFKKIIRNPIIFGYYIHLFTDYYWNKDFNSKCLERKLEFDNYNEKMKIKHNDFKLFNNNFLDNSFTITNIDDSIKLIKEINRVIITKDELKKIESIISEKNDNEGNYIFYNEKDMKFLLNNTIKEIQKLGGYYENN